MGGVIVLNQLSAEIVNSDGYSSVYQAGDPISASSAAVLLAGSDGYAVQFVKTTASGALLIESTGAPTSVLLLDGYGSPLISRTGPPLPNDPGLVVRVVGSSADGYLESIAEQALSSSAVRVAVGNTTTPATFLNANSTRKGATIFNTSNRTLYLGLGAATVSSVDFTIQMASGSYYEVPYGFTGRISGVWATAGSGGATITELT